MLNVSAGPDRNGEEKAVAPAGMLAETTLCTSLFFQVIVSPTVIVPRFCGLNRFWPTGTCTVCVTADADGAPNAIIAKALSAVAARATNLDIRLGCLRCMLTSPRDRKTPDRLPAQRPSA